MTDFSTEVFQNPYLAGGATEVNAVVTVCASGTTAPTSARGSAAEIIIIDISGSMGADRKLQSAQLATYAAIDCIRDGVSFGIVAGGDRAYQAYPVVSVQSGKRLTVSSAQTRAEAKSAVAALHASGGTKIGAWLEAARTAFLTVPGAICHAILLTDGRNGERGRILDAAIERCEGVFQCECRGVGTDWVVDELRKISTRLLGTVDIVAEPSDLSRDFEEMMTSAMGRRSSNVDLRVWTPHLASVSFVKQVAPEIVDLTDRRSPVDDRSGNYPTGAWGTECRDYHVCISVPAAAVGDEMLAARVSLVVDGTPQRDAKIRAIWTDDKELSTRINREVAHYTGQAELADAIQDGLDARRRGDDHTATSKLGRAVQLAAAARNDNMLGLLAGVVDITDSTTGTVRLKRDVSTLDEMTLDTRSVKTARVPKAN